MGEPIRGLPSEEQIYEVLQTVFGFSDFRAGQRDIIRGVLAGEDVVAILPTGSGKSLCYQLPAILLPGMAVVISPLIALMEDQVRALQRRRIPATCLHGGLEPAVVAQRLEECVRGTYKLLYVAPERLRQESFLQRLRACRLSFVAVDEAHCISEWGYDFRPAYLQIASALRRIGNPPVLALTATATPEVQRDIIAHLGLRNPQVFVTGFDRPNLIWRVEQGRGKRERLLALCRQHEGQSVLVYAASRRRVEFIADLLRRNGFSTAAYHAGLPASERQHVQEAFVQGRIPLLVATSAFGLGIDKPDIRAVIHYDPPLTLEAYYQEAGRAGRDGEAAECFLLYDPRDCSVQHQLIASSHPDWETVVHFYRAFRTLVGKESILPLTAVEIANRLRISEATVESLLRLLEYSGILQSMAPDGEVTLRLRATRQELIEYWMRSTVPERRQVAELLLRCVGGEGYHRAVTLSVAEVGKRYGLSAEEFERGLRALLYARLVECEAFSLRNGMWIQQPLPELPPLSPTVLEERRRRAWRQFQQVMAYATTSECKRLFLLRFFHDPGGSGEACGRCSSCVSGSASLPVAMKGRQFSTSVRPWGKRVSQSDVQRQRVQELARQGADLYSISAQTGLPVTTVARFVQECLERGIELPRHSLVPDERFYTAVRIAVRQLGNVPLREIAAALGGVQDYALLRVAVAFARWEEATSGKSSVG